MNLINALIIDDEIHSRNSLKEEIRLHCPSIRLVGEADSVATALVEIERTKPDLLFLDINLGDGTGFSVLERMTWQNCKVIFTTAFDQYAIRAFRCSAVDYLLKPINVEELVEAVKKVMNVPSDGFYKDQIATLIANTIGQKKRIAIQTADGYSVFETDEIVRCQSDNNYTTIYLSNETKLLSAKPLKEYEDLLSNFGFERVHQSHLINALHIKKYSNRDGGNLLLSDGSNIPVAQRKKAAVLKLIGGM